MVGVAADLLALFTGPAAVVVAWGLLHPPLVDTHALGVSSWWCEWRSTSAPRWRSTGIPRWRFTSALPTAPSTTTSAASSSSSAAATTALLLCSTASRLFLPLLSTLSRTTSLRVRRAGRRGGMKPRATPRAPRGSPGFVDPGAARRFSLSTSPSASRAAFPLLNTALATVRAATAFATAAGDPSGGGGLRAIRAFTS